MSEYCKFYFEHIGTEFHLFLKGEPIVFKRYDDMFEYCSSFGVAFDLVIVDLENWRVLYEEGVFDCEE